MSTHNIAHYRTRVGIRRESTADERAEFVQILRTLGVERLRADILEDQSIRCWSHKDHRRGDRSPSLSVNLRYSLWCCHGCGRQGGLVALRKAAGRERHHVLNRNLQASEYLRALATPGADVLAHIPPAAVEALQRRTGRHKRHHVLNRNLRQMIAALCARIDEEQSTTRVRFGQIDALRCGVRHQTWSDLLDLLGHLGLNIERGQSGRTLGALSAGRGRHGALAATLVTVTDNPLSFSDSPSPTDRARVIRKRPEATTAAALATRAPQRPGLLTLSRSPALADLLVSFGAYEDERAATGGTGGRVIVDTLTIGDLVTQHGQQIRRLLRRAEHLGLVSIIRSGRSHGLVTITALGCETIERDHRAGRARMQALADAHQRAWAEVQKRHRERARCARHADSPWVHHAAGFVIHQTTGEIVAIADLRSRALALLKVDARTQNRRTARMLVASTATCAERLSPWALGEVSERMKQ